MPKLLRLALSLLVFFAALAPVHAQEYATGADVSFLAKCEQDGIVFNEGGQPKDVLVMLAQHRYNWIRLRIFNDPSASTEKLPNDLNYTIALAKRARAIGFHLLLDFHYSDRWADPGSQFPPAAWSKHKHKQLVTDVFNYTRDTIAAFAQAGVMPEMVQVGNEITNGMLWPDGKLPEWANFTDLLKAGIQGVDAGRGTARRPRIMIHIDRGANLELATWFFDTLIAHHVPFDVIGLSFYPFAYGEVAELRKTLHALALHYRLPIIVAETAYHWIPSDFINKKADFPESPEGQKAFLQVVDAAVRAVPNGLGRGVFYWEPAAEHELVGRSFFDDQHNVQPVITAFDRPAPH